MNILFLDAETVPSDTKPLLSEVKYPSNYTKPETILKYQEDHLLDEYKKQSLDSMKGRIFCLGWAVGDSNEIGEVQTAYGDEKTILEQLEATIFEDARFSGGLQWCGWNVQGFDIPFIWRKSIKHNLRLKSVVPHNNRVLTLDLMRVWSSDYKDFVKMSAVAEFLGIPHSGVSGSDVYDMWQKGENESIVQHCKEDVQTCIEIYKRIC
jgi:uncharacterized protein YprB with RNaseH-like and TPR domain